MTLTLATSFVLILSGVDAFAPIVSRRSITLSLSMANTTPEDNSSESMIDDTIDFDSNFQSFVDKKGGLENIKAQAAERALQERKQKITKQLNQWQGDQAILFVALTVLIIVGLAISSSEPFERTTDGQQLYFGVR